MSEVELTPEPWAFHLLGLITPLLAISGNILGVLEDQVFVCDGRRLRLGSGAHPRHRDGRVEGGSPTEGVRDSVRGPAMGSWNPAARGSGDFLLVRCQ